MAWRSSANSNKEPERRVLYYCVVPLFFILLSVLSFHFLPFSLSPPPFSHKGLITNLRKNQILKHEKNYLGLLSVDRANYVLGIDPYNSAYVDSPQSIGKGQTISAPHMHAWCLELLTNYTFPGASILDVGSGSGYLSAVFGRLVGKEGLVIGIDRIKSLIALSIENIQKEDGDLLMENGGPLCMLQANAWEGLSGLKCPNGVDLGAVQFDAIHVGAAAATLPTTLLEYLKPGGRMVIPVGTNNQKLIMIDKDQTGNIHQEIVTGVMYVSLVAPSKQNPSIIP